MLTINSQKETEWIIKFVRTTVKNQGFNNVVVALSGGIDSTTSFYLTLKAFKKENIFILVSPYNNYDQQGQKDIDLILEINKISKDNTFKINIKSIVDNIAKFDHKINKTRIGNIMARVRMIFLYDYAKKHQGLVVGTENKSEHLLGYYTRHGDEESDLEPIRHLYKTQVKKLAKYLNIPKQIINKKPTAGLWQGQTDEEELGFSYELADQILQLYIDDKRSIDEIIKQGFDKNIVDKVIKKVKENQFKQKVPYHL